ncbi:MAG TPA: PQQ-binding-like beta-propeller repeat protein [Kofleriaceae bacterium]
MPDCADCGQGELRHGLWLSQGEGSIAAGTDGGVVVLEADAVVFYDRAMRELRRVALDLQDSALVATAGSDTYVVSRAGRALTLAAIDSNGVRWRERIGSDPGGNLGLNGIDAGPEGPFLYGTLDVNLPSLSALGSQVVAFARDDGAVRWSQSFDPRPLIVAPDDAGGAYVAVAEDTIAPDGRAAIHHRDRSGAILWTQTVSGPVFQTFQLVRAITLTAQGDLAFVGAYPGGPLAVGDRTFDVSPDGGFSTYLFVLDHATGAPSDPRIIGDSRGGILHPSHIIAMPSGDFVTSSFPRMLENNADIEISLLGPTGLQSHLRLGGTGDQFTRAMAASDDGTLWLSLSSYEESLYPDGALLTVGSQTFSEQGLYVLDLVL